MTTIIDASVALKWVCAEEGSERAADLLDGRPLAAPSLWLIEASNALWRRVQRGELTRSEAEERMIELAGAPVQPLDTHDMTQPALKIACDLGHPVYDCLYLVTAIRTHGHVITADRRFHSMTSNHPYFSAAVSLL
jgi:predicted nucleic acid-binding protein